MKTLLKEEEEKTGALATEDTSQQGITLLNLWQNLNKIEELQ